MMHSEENCLTFTMPLTLKAREAAQQFRQNHSDSQKAKQVYLNTLAVQAVNSYLSWFGIETDLEANDSWNPAIQSLSDIADLTIKDRGKLECRPVMPGAKSLRVPPEVWADRIGYVAVQFDSELSEATLLGYIPSVTTREVLLNELRSLEDLLDSLNEPVREPIKLGQWLHNLIETGWQTLEELAVPPQLAFSFRNTPTVTQGKLLDLGTDEEPRQVALLVELIPTPQPEMDINVTLIPTGSQSHLPSDLELLVLDEADIAVMQAQSRNTDMIQLKFSALPGEQFSIKVILDAFSFTEAFVL